MSFRKGRALYDLKSAAAAVEVCINIFEMSRCKQSNFHSFIIPNLTNFYLCWIKRDYLQIIPFLARTRTWAHEHLQTRTNCPDKRLSCCPKTEITHQHSWKRRDYSSLRQNNFCQHLEKVRSATLRRVFSPGRECASWDPVSSSVTTTSSSVLFGHNRPDEGGLHLLYHPLYLRTFASRKKNVKKVFPPKPQQKKKKTK